MHHTNDANTFTFRDTTLREGIQVPGTRVSLDDKRRYIATLDRLGVPEIEIGLPDGVTACLELADLIRQGGHAVRPTALIPCYTTRWQTHIDLAAEHHMHRVDVLCPFSDELLRQTDHYGMTADDITPKIDAVVAHTAATDMRVSVACMDATRAPIERILDATRGLADKGVSRLTIYDSVGCATPTQMKSLVEQVRETSGLAVLVHCHNDYGMATANTLAAIEGGASAADVAVNGLGGRAGNAALEEVALALENLFGRNTGVALALLADVSRQVADMTGIPVSTLKPVVGEFCFAHSPVMHIRCIAGGNPGAFEPYDPAQVGARRTYEFSLPVDYTKALEPFAQRAGVTLTPERVELLMPRLRAAPQPRGWTEDEVVEHIRQVAGTAATAAV